MAGIPLGTRLGTEIPNSQLAEIDPRRRKDFRSLIASLPFKLMRAPESGQYNCHGMVFAARRTRIVEHDFVEIILREDGYVSIPETEAMVGDLVIYRHQGEIQHSGVITEISRVADAGRPFVSKVLSKWGEAAEYFHHPALVPNIYGTYEVWTERPIR